MVTIDSLIPFELLFDLDFGLLQVVNKYFHNNDIFYLSLFNDPDELIKLLALRNDPNPLSVIIDSKISKEECDNLYNQFMEKEFDKIFENSNKLLCYDVVRLSLDSGGVVNMTVLCKNEKQQQLLNKYLPKAKTVIYSKDMDISLYGTIYVKNIYDLYNYKQLSGKNLYVPNYPFNLEKNEWGFVTTILSVSVDFINDNIIKIFNPYDIEYTKKDKEEGE